MAYIKPNTRRPRWIELQQQRSKTDADVQVVPANPSGEQLPDDGWQTVYRVCTIDIRTLTGYEIVQAMQVESERTVEFTIRWRAGIDATWRVQYKINGAVRFFDINAAIDLNEQHQYLTLICKEAA